MSVSLMTLQVAEDLGYDTSNGTADTGECVDGESQLSATSFQIRRKRAVTNYSYTTKEVTESDVQSEVGLHLHFFQEKMLLFSLSCNSFVFLFFLFCL